jgi:hypothetical protein
VSGRPAAGIVAPDVLSREERSMSTRMPEPPDTFKEFVISRVRERFREAAEKLREGDRSASFPPGSFPPALPFVADVGVWRSSS